MVDRAAVTAWQIDNEYGCHDTTLSYSESARAAFADWLRRKYETIDRLNAAWGTVFWSMELRSFDEVTLPNLTVTEPNPAQLLDFRRFSSDAVATFHRQMVAIVKRHAPGRTVTHNFMGAETGFDHFDVARDLDVASWDSYPLGFLERLGRDAAWKSWYLRAGDPDFQAFHHDLYRGVGRGRMWVMEQQPGPVNWAAWNPSPHPGMVRLWALEAVAHGAELVSFFRWRQAPFAQEQFHTGLLRSDGSDDVAASEVRETADDLKTLAPSLSPEPPTSPIALVFDYPSAWSLETQPQAADASGLIAALEVYRALRRLGQSIDVVGPDADFSRYRLVVVPQLVIATEAFADAVGRSGARVLFAPRCGSRTEAHRIPDALPPGPLRSLIDVRVLRAESLRPGARHPLQRKGTVHHWFEDIAPGPGVTVKETLEDGRPVWLASGRVSYLAGWPDETALFDILTRELDEAGLRVLETGDDLRIRDHGALRTIVNYGPKPHDASDLIGDGDTILLGGATLDVAGVCVVRRAEPGAT
ncbi:MAG: beta-galactosidase [Pseudomonadota bacterium]